MIGNKIVFGLIFFFLLTFSCFGQKIKYKDYKDDISIKKYQETIKSPKYSPIVAGVCNYVFPSAGYYYVGEPIRGACVLGSQLLASGMFFYGLFSSMGIDSETRQSSNGARVCMLSGMIASGLIHVWSIYDVVKIAKIKNLAYQDNRIAMKLNPNLSFTSKTNKKSVILGLRLTVNIKRNRNLQL